jgi:hypothetical protein
VANLSVPEEEEGRKGGDVVSFRHGIASVHINLEYVHVQDVEGLWK